MNKILRGAGSLKKIDILGRKRKVTKVGRNSMIVYKGKQICLTEARRIEKLLRKQTKETHQTQ